MNKHYTCLDCSNSGDSNIIRIYRYSDVFHSRLLCCRCKSFNIIQFNELTGERLHPNGDIDSLYKPGNIPAMSEEQKNIEIFVFRINQIASELVGDKTYISASIRQMEQQKILKEDLQKEIKEKLEQYERTLYDVISGIYRIKNMIDK